MSKWCILFSYFSTDCCPFALKLADGIELMRCFRVVLFLYVIPFSRFQQFLPLLFYGLDTFRCWQVFRHGTTEVFDGLTDFCTDFIVSFICTLFAPDVFSAQFSDTPDAIKRNEDIVKPLTHPQPMTITLGGETDEWQRLHIYTR